MARVRFTPQAKTDLLAINRFIAQDNPSAARRLIANIRQQCERLAEFPEMGRLWEELNPPLRSFPVGNYLIFYRPGSRSGIEVIAVVSGYQDIEALFARRQGN
ncbi:type II toxin-antitoxin system RelE/ParE family toxin [Microcoleus sp. FACHB-1515]|uniref:type II toxin-antitoxin system RelE/ParE family toxin n=1 Tax=Cyanophyceae TaxID=3028117 RepID=UPI0016868E14|nr:type II toxin-antitoxin system RelE/ParE family toxin [Microcoleus sp. FACHB-1515]MBD2091568.1 type II toxin-antitoxin system RelE/ParE family toxin [Microcoleus sp. FACHB-1515]